MINDPVARRIYEEMTITDRPMTARELGQLMPGMSSQAIGGKLRNLQSRGYIKKVRNGWDTFVWVVVA